MKIKTDRTGLGEEGRREDGKGRRRAAGLSLSPTHILSSSLVVKPSVSSSFTQFPFFITYIFFLNHQSGSREDMHQKHPRYKLPASHVSETDTLPPSVAPSSAFQKISCKS